MADASKTVKSPYFVSKDITWSERGRFSFKKRYFFLIMVLLMAVIFSAKVLFYKKEQHQEFEVVPDLPKVKKQFDLCRELNEIHRNGVANISFKTLKKCRLLFQ